MENNQNNFFFSNSRTRITAFYVVIALITLIILSSLFRDKIMDDDNWQVSFSGRGKVQYQPDIANVYMGVKIDKKEKADEALKELSDKVEKVLTSVKALGIPESDINTEAYSLTPHYDFENNVSKLTGYDASQIIAVKLKNINENPEKISQMIKTSSDAGINQINNIAFEPSNLEDLQQQARIAAINDAKNKANEMANSIGIRLKKIIGWWENSYPIPYYSQQAFDGKGGGAEVSASIPAGVNEIIVDVNINYLLK